jgi:hypothetical protein
MGFSYERGPAESVSQFLNARTVNSLLPGLSAQTGRIIEFGHELFLRAADHINGHTPANLVF